MYSPYCTATEKIVVCYVVCSLLLTYVHLRSHPFPSIWSHPFTCVHFHILSLPFIMQCNAMQYHTNGGTMERWHAEDTKQQPSHLLFTLVVLLLHIRSNCLLFRVIPSSNILSSYSSLMGLLVAQVFT